MSETNYYYDETNELHPFTIEMPANQDSIPPLNALRIKPKFKEGHHPCEKDGEWVLIEDNRGITVYSISTKEPLIISELGAIPDSYTRLIPHEIFDKWNGSKWIEDTETKNQSIKDTNQSKINEMIKETTQKIEILQDIVDLGMQENNEDEQLKEWKRYRILLTRIDTNNIEITWPIKPQ